MKTTKDEHRCGSRAPLWVAALLLAATPLQAQFNPADLAGEDDEILTIDDDQELIDFSTDINIVSVPVVVRGPKGVYVNGLEQHDFVLLDNNKPQEVTGFDVSFQPISMVICIETSDRIKSIIDPIRNTALLFTNTVLGEFGEAAIVGFDSRIKVLRDFTDDTDELDRTLKRFRTGANGIRMSDAVYEAIRMLNKRPENHKKVVVVVSEGQDNGSYINLGETLRTAQLHNVMVYPIYMSTLKARLKDPPPVPNRPFPPGVSPLPAAPGSVNTPTTMQQSRWSATPNMIPLVADLVVGVKNLVFKDASAVLRAGTGAADFKPMTSEGLQEAIVSIGEDLRSQYLLSYTPNNLNEQGILHEIQVKVPYPNAIVRHRPYYFYGPRPVVEGEPVFVDNTQ